MLTKYQIHLLPTIVPDCQYVQLTQSILGLPGLITGTLHLRSQIQHLSKNCQSVYIYITLPQRPKIGQYYLTPFGHIRFCTPYDLIRDEGQVILNTNDPHLNLPIMQPYLFDMIQSIHNRSLTSESCQYDPSQQLQHLKKLQSYLRILILSYTGIYLAISSIILHFIYPKYYLPMIIILSIFYTITGSLLYLLPALQYRTQQRQLQTIITNLPISK